MKVDFYTKAVLTVIAVVLTISFIKDLGFIENVQANASNHNTSQNLSSSANVVDVNIVSVKGNYWGKLDVEVKNTPEVKISNTPNVNISNTPTVKVTQR